MPQTLSLSSKPSATGQTPITTFPANYPNHLDDRYLELQGTSIPSRLDWSTFVAPPPFFGQQLGSNRIHIWALNRLQYRHDVHKDTQKIFFQIFTQHNLCVKFEITVKLNNLVHHPFTLSPTNMRARSLTPPPPICQNTTYLQVCWIHKKDNRLCSIFKYVYRNIIHLKLLLVFLITPFTLSPFVLLEPIPHQNI